MSRPASRHHAASVPARVFRNCVIVASFTPDSGLTCGDWCGCGMRRFLREFAGEDEEAEADDVEGEEDVGGAPRGGVGPALGLFIPACK